MNGIKIKSKNITKVSSEFRCTLRAFNKFTTRKNKSHARSQLN